MTELDAKMFKAAAAFRSGLSRVQRVHPVSSVEAKRSASTQPSPRPYRRRASRKLRTSSCSTRSASGKALNMLRISRRFLSVPQANSPTINGWQRTCSSNSKDLRRSAPARKCSIQTEVSTRIMRWRRSAVSEPVEVVSRFLQARPTGGHSL